METNNLIKLNGYKALIKELGAVQAEKFISLIQTEPFDYTEWQKNIWIDKSVDEISGLAVELRQKKNMDKLPSSNQ